MFILKFVDQLDASQAQLNAQKTHRSNLNQIFCHATHDRKQNMSVFSKNKVLFKSQKCYRLKKKSVESNI